MKRFRLLLDENVLASARHLAGERSASATVRRALTEYVRRAGARRILELRGSGLWEGDLAALRERPST
ncbi:MAG: type II toxin-antitoxin system VapB family antitoxin [Deltaproteobacteria bacterium]|nr:type II toxin-antitoxin system VapB family antitoxin [Deltaproteobacteria bacterium]